MAQPLNHDLLKGAAAAGAYIGITARAVYHMVENDQLPCIRKGRIIFFRKSDLETAFSSGVAA